MKSRPIQAISNESTKQSTETLYCVCRKPDSGKWMIGCDGCDDWFHGECVSLEQEDEDLVDQYFCPNCQGKGLGIITWKRKCRLSSCRNAAAITNTPPSKYCSPEHGVEFFRIKYRGAEYAPEELATVVDSVTDVSSFRKLGDGVPAPQSPVSRSRVEHYFLRDSEQLEPQKEALNARRAQVNARSMFISMVKDHQRRIGDELRGEIEQTAKGAKEICGFDSRLALDNEEFADWCHSEEGRAIFALGRIEGRDGLCIRRKCDKHKYWLRIAMEDIELEERLITDGFGQLLVEENGHRQRQHIKSLMENERLR